MYYVYVVECADGTYYTGYTTDVERRVAEHDAGEGAKYTRARRRCPANTRSSPSLGGRKSD